MDLILQVDRMPVAGESYFGKEYHQVPGGKGANQAVAASRLGGNVSFCGRVGADAQGQRLISALESHGIDPNGVVRDPDHQTGLAVIVVEANGQNRIFVYAGANMEIDVEDVTARFDTEFDAVMINFEIPDAIVEQVYRLTRELSIPLILDAGPARPYPLDTLTGVEVLSPNETETKALTGLGCDTEGEIEAAARELQARSQARLVVIKLGNRGSLAYDGTRMYRRQPIPIEVVDTTAAGDAFTAGFAVRYLTSGDIIRALDFGTAAATVAVSRLGAQPSLPTESEAEELLVESSR